MTSAFAVADAFHRLHHGIVTPDYEQLLEQTYRSFLKSGDTVIDIGAHAGRHTSVFAAIVGVGGWVEAFEPIPHLFSELQRRFDGSPQVHLHNQALSNSAGAMAFTVVPDALELSGLRERLPAEDMARSATIMVDVSTLDLLSTRLQRVDYMKIDVEGAEIDCLDGGGAMLRRFRPLISVEYGRPSYSLYGNQARTLYDTAQRHGYVISDLFANVMSGLEEWEAVCDHAYWDFFLVPYEKLGAWQSIFRRR
jgi:FkbM family methyltransferase